MKKNCRLAILLAFLFVLAFLLSQVYLIVEADHDCEGDDCPICQVIAAIGNTRKSVFLLAVISLLAAALRRGFVGALSYTDRGFFQTTPVSLKVKLSD